MHTMYVVYPLQAGTPLPEQPRAPRLVWGHTGPDNTQKHNGFSNRQF